MNSKPFNRSHRFLPPNARLLLVSGGLLVTLLAGARAQSYLFSTLAGRPGAYGNVDGTGGNARFTSPQAVAADSAGNLYVADNWENTIRKVTSQSGNWAVATLAGQAGAIGSADGTNSNARFNQPGAIAVDSMGVLFVADTGNHTIRQIVKSGRSNYIVSTIAGAPGAAGSSDGTNSSARFNAPSGLAVDSAGNVYVADTGNNTIRQLSWVDPDWVVSTVAGLAGANHSGSADGTNAQARFNGPTGLALDGAGNLFVSDTLNHTIRKLSLLGTNWVVSTLAGRAGSAGSADGTNGNARFNSPAGIAVDAATNFYVADSGNNTIRKATPAGTNWVVSTLGGVAGAFYYDGSDGVGSAAHFLQPQGVAVDATGTLYVADTWDATVRSGKAVVLVQIARAGSSVVLSWPLAASNYVLETRNTLAPGASWTPLTTGIVTNASGYSLTRPTSGAAAFFRLRQ